MAPGICDKILMLFSLGPNKKKNGGSANSRLNAHDETILTQTLPIAPPAEGDTREGCSKADIPSDPNCSGWTGLSHEGTLQDSPPAYTVYPSDTTQEELPCDYPDERVQICPHDILSFERRRRLVNLPDFRYNEGKVDALTPDSNFHHRGRDSKTKECQDTCLPLGVIEAPGFIGSLRGFGTYSYRTPCIGRAGGLALSFHWEMQCLDRDQITYRTTTELQEYFKTTGISFCPHIMLSDMDIVNMVHPIINKHGKPADPFDRYLVRGGFKICAICPTEIKVRVQTDIKQRKVCRLDTKRWFGEGSGRNEQWRSQCVKQSESPTKEIVWNSTISRAIEGTEAFGILDAQFPNPDFMF